MKKMNVLAISAAIASVIVSGTATAELSGNFGASNNYLWRGVTQTDDQAAISGGIDYSNESGVYAGAWASNVDFSETDPVTSVVSGNGSYELDLYAGYAGETESLAYDFGVIIYMYPLDEDLDFTEVYGGVDVAGVEFDLAITVDSDAGGEDQNIYASLGYGFDVGNDLTLGLLVGKYDFEADAADDYVHYGVSLSKGDFSFSLEANDIDEDDDMRAVVAWGQGFEL